MSMIPSVVHLASLPPSLTRVGHHGQVAAIVGAQTANAKRRAARIKRIRRRGLAGIIDKANRHHGLGLDVEKEAKLD